MSKIAANADPKTRNDPRGRERRRRIYQAMHDCILAKGYIKTTLADIAAAAEMSPSHLLYYFKGKEDILENYFAAVAVRFLARLDEFKSHSAREQISLLADFWFKGETSAKREIGFMLECFGAAVHDDVLRVTKAQFDLQCKAYLREVLDVAASGHQASSKDGAELAYALMIGLRSAVYFDDDIDLDDAHRLFKSTLSGMCGFN